MIKRRKQNTQKGLMIKKKKKKKTNKQKNCACTEKKVYQQLKEK